MLKTTERCTQTNDKTEPICSLLLSTATSSERIWTFTSQRATKGTARRASLLTPTKKKRDQGPLSSHLCKQSGNHPHRGTGVCSADVTHSGLESQTVNERRTAGSAGVMTSCWCPFWKLVVSRKVLWTQPFPFPTRVCPCVFGVITLAGPRWPHPALLLPVLTEQQIKKLQTQVNILIA